MRIIIGLGLVLTAILFASCEKTEPITVAPASNYMPLAVGNYWVYDYYYEDSVTHQFTASNTLDSVYIDQDTIINGQLYYALNTASATITKTEYVRYSDNKLVTSTGKVKFAADPALGVYTIDTITNQGNDFLSVSYYSTGVILDFELAVGNFRGIQISGTVHYSHNGITEPRPSPFVYYAEGIGEIMFHGYVPLNDQRVERRIMRYHIQ